MMNLQRMIKAAEWMLKIHETGDKFDLSQWKKPDDSNTTYSSMHKCGTSACFGGWLAVSPDFKKEGGEADIGGCPIFDNHEGYEALNSYFGFDEISNLADPWQAFVVYGKSSIYVTALDVAEKLLELVKAEVENG